MRVPLEQPDFAGATEGQQDGILIAGHVAVEVALPQELPLRLPAALQARAVHLPPKIKEDTAT